MALTYKDAGVDIDAGDELVGRIGPIAATATRPEVLGGIGGFAGLCQLPAGYRNPVLVSGTDGVGTKLKTAFATGRHRGVGVDLVAMSVNDVAVTGAEPLFFLDYFATSRLEVDVAAEVVAGIADACREVGCALLGGETAELPGLYAASEYDLAGFCVGVVEREDIRDGTEPTIGDRIVGLASVGLHSNGHSLARKALLETLGLDLDATPDVLGGASVADELLRPTRLYVTGLAALTGAEIRWKAASHITGGGLIDNPPRMFGKRRDQLAVRLDTSSWPVPPIFELIQSAGVDTVEMRRTFNMGLGMCLVVDPAQAKPALETLASAGYAAWDVGEVTGRSEGEPEVRFA